METFNPDDNYDDYLHTNHWEKTRQSAIARAGNVCENCGISGGKYILHCHHFTYQNKWNEQPDDLIVLCIACHEDVHSRGVDVHRNYKGSDSFGDPFLFSILLIFAVIGLFVISSFIEQYSKEFLFFLIIAFIILSAILILKNEKPKLDKTEGTAKEDNFEPEEPNPYFHCDPATGNYIVTRWGTDIVCTSRKAAEIVSSDLTDNEVNRELAKL